MKRRNALTLTLLLLAGFSWSLVGSAPPASRPIVDAPRQAAKYVPGKRTVFLGVGLKDENLLVFTAAIAAAGEPGVVLLDNATSESASKHFLANYKAEQVLPVGDLQREPADLEQRLKITALPAVAWKRGPPTELWKLLLPKAERVVVCPAEPRGQLLHAACLAAAVRAPLFVLRGDGNELTELRRWLADTTVREVLAVGAAAKECRTLEKVEVTPLADVQAVREVYLQSLMKQGAIETLVIANPADATNGNMSTLAPFVASQRRAALLLTNQVGDNANDVIRAALNDRRLASADNLIVVANLKAILMEKRPNPVEGGKDTHIEMEPFTPAGTEPFTFATGRLFHDDPNIVLLQLARRQLLPGAKSPRKALLVGNPAGDLPLLETFSRNLGKELKNAGYQTEAFFGEKVERKDVRLNLPDADLFLWQGHHETLVKKWGVPTWPEPMHPSLVFLESCLALTEEEAQPFLARGAMAVIGTSTRTYSGSGGAFTLGFVDGILYDGQSLGGSLRQAKNFLLAYAMLKEKRLGQDAKLRGANLRSAWAFTLWGDPTVRLPAPEPPTDALPRVRHDVRGNSFTIHLPEKAYDKVTTEKFYVQMLPNARLAGLVTKDEGAEGKRLMPLLYAEVKLPTAPADKKPKLTSKLPENNYVFNWDARRQCGHLVILPRAKDVKEIRFQVEWE